MGMWHGFYPTQAIFAKKRFRKVLINPPCFDAGSWCGAGKLWIDMDNGEYWLTSRPRMGPEKRGYAVEIYRSRDGESYSLVTWLMKEELSEFVGRTVQSIENQQLLRDPLTGKYHLYLSLDTAERNIAGDEKKIFESKWETFLLIADDPAGPWEPWGFTLRGDRDYDAAEARDCTIDIVDGRYICLYKARKAGANLVHTALAVSSDGKNWTKLGIPNIDGNPQPNYFLLSGSIYAGSAGPIFIGTKTLDVVKGAALTKYFASYIIDYRSLNLESIFVAEWKPGSRYEHPQYPIHTYCNVVHDPLSDKWLTWIEAVDPTSSKEPGLNTEVDRVLLYVSERAVKS
jgi:hypothetical protein